jgi:hypothetical protein
LKVVQCLNLSENSSERNRSYRNCGIVYCHVAREHWLVGNDPFEVAIDIPAGMDQNFVLPVAPTETDDEDE